MLQNKSDSNSFGIVLSECSPKNVMDIGRHCNDVNLANKYSCVAEFAFRCLQQFPRTKVTLMLLSKQCF